MKESFGPGILYSQGLFDCNAKTSLSKTDCDCAWICCVSDEIWQFRQSTTRTSQVLSRYVEKRVVEESNQIRWSGHFRTAQPMHAEIPTGTVETTKVLTLANLCQPLRSSGFSIHEHWIRHKKDFFETIASKFHKQRPHMVVEWFFRNIQSCPEVAHAHAHCKMKWSHMPLFADGCSSLNDAQPLFAIQSR